MKILLFSPDFFIFVSIFIFIIGLSIGSFLNVVIFRLPSGNSVVYPPSSCPACGSRIKFYDNIPVISYILLFGRCRNCRQRISLIYPAVELLTGVLLLALFLKYFYQAYFFYKINSLNIVFFRDYLFRQLDYFIVCAVFVIILIPVFFIDLFNQIIPDSLNILLIIFGFGLNIFLIKTSFFFPLFGFLGGGLFFFLVAVFYEKIRNKEGLGGGDIKLIAGIGSFLGLKGVIFSIFIGSIFALIGFIVASIFFNLYKKTAERVGGDHLSVSGDKKIPFGPFLSLAAILYIFYGINLINAYVNFIKR